MEQAETIHEAAAIQAQHQLELGNFDMQTCFLTLFELATIIQRGGASVGVRFHPGLNFRVRFIIKLSNSDVFTITLY